ncbi:MAG TPA: DHHA1 domain-containing protein [Phycisphaerae bacterium]|nr:DHHA1 domain-containing protein [Phycisphaerae bacterium]HNU45907.1 DHHA1 domain-containing protein [Phycisphaerae bacterium]
MSLPGSETLKELARWVSGWRRPLLATHTRPDGDALGALAAMYSVLRAGGAEPLAVIYDALPERYALAGTLAPLRLWPNEVGPDERAAVDGIVLLDTCTYAQLEPLAEFLRAARMPKLAVDHHLTRDEMCDRYLVDETAAATGLILYEWFAAVGWPLEAACCDGLVIGIATDTGWFRHGHVDARVFRAMADLAGRGADATELFQQLYFRDSIGRLRLRTAALASLELMLRDRLAVMCVSPGTMQRVGALPSDTEEIVNEPLRVGSVCASVLLVGEENGTVRASFRSKRPLEPEAPDIDVARIAERFGGGGHRRAAGARVQGTVLHVRRRLLDEFECLLPGADDDDPLPV